MKKQSKEIQEKKIYNQFAKEVSEIADEFVKEFSQFKDKPSNSPRDKKQNVSSRFSPFK